MRKGLLIVCIAVILALVSPLVMAQDFGAFIDRFLPTLIETLQNKYVMWIIGVTAVLIALYTLFLKGTSKIFGEGSKGSKTIALMFAILSVSGFLYGKGRNVFEQVSTIGLYGGFILGLFAFISLRGKIVDNRFEFIARKASPIALFVTGFLWLFIGSLFNTGLLTALGLLAVVLSPVWIIVGGAFLRRREEAMMMDERYREKMDKKRLKDENKLRARRQREHDFDNSALRIETELRKAAQEDEDVLKKKLNVIENDKQRKITSLWSYLKVLRNIQSEINSFMPDIKKGYKIQKVESLIQMKDGYKSLALPIVQQIEEIEQHEVAIEKQEAKQAELRESLEKQALSVTESSLSEEEREARIELRKMGETAETAEKAIASEERRKIEQEERRSIQLIETLEDEKSLTRKEAKLLQRLAKNNAFDIEMITKMKYYIEHDLYDKAFDVLNDIVSSTKREEKVIIRAEKEVAKQKERQAKSAELESKKGKVETTLGKDIKQEYKGMK